MFLGLYIFAGVLIFSIGAQDADASNLWSWHWKKNSSGGYERWITYRDYTSSTVYTSSIGVNHNMAHYYYADNYVKPYRITSGTPQINFYSSKYSMSWYGLTTASSTSGSHFVSVMVQFDESDSLTSSRKHSLICHEGGHSLGLDHQTSTTSCMYPNSAYWPEDANSHDHSTLKSAYNHTTE